jgi:serine/threonine protein kinase
MDVPQIVAGRFRIECEIGRGGMGTVYRATHLGLERAVAVKIIKQEFATDQAVAERFMREARTMAKLRHRSAAMIFDAGNLPDGRHFIVMEFVEGETLSEALAREGRFMPDRAVQIAAEICDVLSEAHSLGIVHRDLKPSNIMLNERGVCVLDFGVAKVLATSAAAEASSTHATTGSGFIVGTPRYMSPEQCLGQKVGARSDLYSLGVLLYEMLAGQPPFTDAMASAVLVKQATMAPPPLPKIRQDVPRPLALAVHTLLAKQPTDRPMNAAATRRMLEKSLTRADVDMPDAEPFASTMAALSSSRSVVFRAATPVFLIAILGALLFAWGRTGLDVPKTSAQDMTQASFEIPRTKSGSNVAEAVTPLEPVPAFSGDDAPAATQEAPLSIEAARHLVNSASPYLIDEVLVLHMGREQAIAVVYDQQRKDNSHLFVMRKQGTRYRVASRTPLDKSDFKGADWKLENLDVDGDGFDEVLCVGTSAKRPISASRFVLYVPRTRQTYSLRHEPPMGRRGRARITLSSSAMTSQAAPYRTFLQRRARAVTGSF